jgi:uncharacterized protein YabN with tetrapyrrole methylase and pyrophosphatase domain
MVEVSGRRTLLSLGKYLAEHPKATGISIVGAGLVFPDNITLRGLAALENADRIFASKEHASSLQELGYGYKVTICEEYLEYGRKRSEAHDAIAKRILEYAKEHESVAWLSPGSPIVNCGVSNSLLRSCGSMHLTICLAPSSVDEVAAQEKGYLGASGLQYVSAYELLLADIELCPQLPCVVLQVARCAVAVNTLDLAPRREAVQLLVDKLTRIYPKDHLVSLIVCADSHSHSSLIRTRLFELASHHLKIRPNSSLFIPATAMRREDKAILEHCNNVEKYYETPLFRQLRLASGGCGD